MSSSVLDCCIDFCSDILYQCCLEVCCSERREPDHYRINQNSENKSSDEQPTFSEAAVISEDPRMRDNNWDSGVTRIS